MTTFETLVGDWTELVARLDRLRTIERWKPDQLSLASVTSIGQLPTMLGGERVAVDGVLCALVRIAARDGGDDADAALVVVHLLRTGIEALAHRFYHRGPDVLALVVGELTCRVRTFPWKVSHPYPRRLLLDTKHALWNGELRPIVDGRRPHEAFLIDPSHWHDYVTPLRDRDDVDLVDLLTWAARSGAVAADDLRLLVALEVRRGYGNQARQSVADEWGINERTLRRRRDKALAKLRAAANDYLAVVA